MKAETRSVTCRIGTTSSSYKIRDNCGSCEYFYSKRGDHWLDDVVKCTCPRTLKKGDKLIITPAQYQVIKKKTIK